MRIPLSPMLIAAAAGDGRDSGAFGERVLPVFKDEEWRVKSFGRDVVLVGGMRNYP